MWVLKVRERERAEQSYISRNDDRISPGKLFWTSLSRLIKRPGSYMQIGAEEMALKPGVTGADKP